MPCTKCEEGKYKWGKTGECKYDTLQDCESANSKYNKMQPTPLGKKSYEEYEKELKEFNLSKVERVELAVKDYKPLAVRMEKLNSQINKNVAFQLAAYEKIQKGVKIAKNDSLEVKTILEEARSQYKKDIQAAKELGVDDSIFTKTFGLIEKLAERSNKDIAELKVIK